MMETRTLAQIQQEIAGNYSHLSRVSILRHLQDVVAVATYIFQTILGLHKTEVQEIVGQARPATKGWYRARILEFQYGYSLEVVDGVPAYSEINEDARIIAFCHIAELIGMVVAKVAKEDREELLTQGELDALDDYIRDVKYPGTAVLVVNQPADELTMELDVWVDPAKIDSQGRTPGTSTYPISDAINTYFEEAEFGGKLSVSAFVDAIQQLDGVEEIRLLYIEANTHTDVNTVIFDLENGINEVTYDSEAGHMIVADPLTINIFSNV